MGATNTLQSQTETAKYYIPNWVENFESGKSKNYNNKSQCYMPCKQGLGLRRILRHEYGAALYGAWCSIIQLLSRQHKPRNGYLTHDGTLNGKSLTAEDISIATDIPEKYITELIDVCCSDSVGWICTTTIGIPEGYQDTTIVERTSVCDGKGKGKGEGKGEGRGKGELDLDFDKFWNAYPKQRSKHTAMVAFVNAGDRPPIDEMLEIITKHQNSDEWKKDAGKFIPNPAKWLTEGCWNDVMTYSENETFVSRFK